jgi:hypothetical protein
MMRFRWALDVFTSSVDRRQRLVKMQLKKKALRRELSRAASRRGDPHSKLTRESPLGHANLRPRLQLRSCANL